MRPTRLVPPARALLVAALVLPLVTLVGCSSLGATGDKGYISGDGLVRVIDPADRGTPIELEGTSMTGEPVDSADYRGKALVVNTWWSGCGPCRAEMPMLGAVADELGRDAALVGINIRDASAAQGLAFMRKVGADYPSIYDPKGQTMLAFSGRVSMASIPTTVVLDPRGRLAAAISGEVPSKQTLVDVVQDVAGQDAGNGREQDAVRGTGGTADG